MDGLLLIGLIGALVGWIILVTRSFRQNILLGFATIVFWPITVFVLIKNWGVKGKDIRYPFFITLIGTMVFGGALPIAISHRDYPVRARVSEAASLSGAAKAAVELAYKEGLTLGALPSHASLGLAAPASYSSKYVGRVTVDRRGVITASLTDDPDLGGAADGTVTYTPGVRGDKLEWLPTCSFANKWCPRR